MYAALTNMADIIDIMHRDTPLGLLQHVVMVAQQHNAWILGHQRLLGDRDEGIGLPAAAQPYAATEDGGATKATPRGENLVDGVASGHIKLGTSACRHAWQGAR